MKVPIEDHIMFLADDMDGTSRYFTCETWERAEKLCREENWDLVGEYVSSYPAPDWMTTGEIIH